MKVLFIHNRYQHRGGEDAVLDMERRLLDSHGHATETLSFDNESIAGVAGKVSAAMKAVYNPQSAKKLGFRISAFSPDVIHVHNLFFDASPSVLYQAKKMGIPVVATLHNYRLICANAMLIRSGTICEKCIHSTFPSSGIINKCYRNSAVQSGLVTAITGTHKMLGTWKNKVDAYITLSGFMRNKILSGSAGLEAGKVFITPNAIADPGQGSSVRDDYFLFVGRISAEKGILQLARKFAETGDRLVIAGDGPLAESIREIAATAANINYLGLQPAETIIRYMKHAKALVFPSTWYEGMPMTIIEAFATGTPVLASRLGSMEEMIEEGSNGFLFEPGNMDDLHELLKRIKWKEELYNRARSSYLEKYSEEVHYNNILNIYKQLSDGQHKNPIIAKSVNEHQHQYA
ncbi:glycosyltransferase [Flavihumibacter solisilvae]|uniref:Glycosyl transferase family 1 n=1 Tax=Flavihumibacter solisilvae TaxID=1349421 RepID=A0A0C1LBC2_9BACT|nr:glycosyltransferase [Flavihumibacter solisilvae]KIC92828.1 hypothetical protein OI18_20610 [Flavihumibacter solisilvae]